jgi:hypothetical protein
MNDEKKGDGIKEKEKEGSFRFSVFEKEKVPLLYRDHHIHRPYSCLYHHRSLFHNNYSRMISLIMTHVHSTIVDLSFAPTATG